MTEQKKQKRVLDTLYGPDGEKVFRADREEMYERLVMNDFGEGYKVRRFNYEFLIPIETCLEWVEGMR